MGTSLVVHPFASLVDRVPETCVRVLINMEPAGDIGELDNDVVLLGKCDEIVQQLAAELGWGEDLKEAWAATADSVETEANPGSDTAVETPSTDTTDTAVTKESLEDEVDKLADAIGASLTTKDSAEQHPTKSTASTDSPSGDKEQVASSEASNASKPDVDAPAPPGDVKPQGSDTKVRCTFSSSVQVIQSDLRPLRFDTTLLFCFSDGPVL